MREEKDGDKVDREKGKKENKMRGV